MTPYECDKMAIDIVNCIRDFVESRIQCGAAEYSERTFEASGKLIFAIAQMLHTLMLKKTDA